MEKISVIVPVYNVQKYLNRCIESIINQTYTNIEIILVDDGSKDSSGKICDEYCLKDKRIKVIHKKNAGLGFARNTGLENASGEFVAFIDGDDSIKSDHLENMIKAIKKYNADTCIGGHTRVYEKSQVERKNVCAGHVFSNEEVKKEILTRMVGSKPDGTDYIEMSVCMVLLSKKVIDDNRLRFHSEREYISEDLIFDFDYYSKSKKVVIIDDVGYLYYDNGGSLTTKYNPNRFNQQKILTKEVIQRAQNLGIYSACEQRILNTFISISRYSIKLEVKFCNNNYISYLNKVKNIVEDDMLKQALDAFNNKEMVKKSRIVNILIKHKCYKLLWYTMKFKNRVGV